MEQKPTSKAFKSSLNESNPAMFRIAVAATRLCNCTIRELANASVTFFPFPLL